MNLREKINNEILKNQLIKNGVEDMTERYNSILTTMTKLLTVLMLLLITGSTAQARQLTALNTLESNQNQYVTVKFNDEPLADALLKLTRQAKVGISYST